MTENENVRMVAVDGRDALAYVIVLPNPEKGPGHVLIDAGANGIDKAQAVKVLRHVADLWDAEVRRG